MERHIVHTYQIGGDLPVGWYAFGREGTPLIGPFESEEACKLLTGIDSEGRAFRYEINTLGLNNPAVTDVQRELAVINSHPWYAQTEMLLNLLTILTEERDALSEDCDTLQSTLDKLKREQGLPL